MNKRIPSLIFLFVLLLVSATGYSQAVSISTATGGLAGAAQIGGTPNIAIIGVQLNKAAGGGNTVTNITVGMSPTPVGKFTNVRLYESADATFSGVLSETLIASGSISATDFSFTGAPLTNFDGATAAADDEYFFVVVDVNAAVTTGATTTPSLASTGVTVSTGSASGTTITGTTYTFTALEADFTQNGASSTALADEDGVTLLDFTVNSNGTQTLSPNLIFTFDVDVTNILENWDLQVGGADIPGTEIYTLNGPGTQLTVSGFTGVDVTNATTFTLLADIQAGATSANDFIITLATSGVTITPGIPEAFAPFTNSIDVTGLEADFTQNADAGTAMADQNGVELLDFTVNSNGTQTISPNLVFTFNVDVTNILENWDLQVGGADIPGTEIYTLNGPGTQLTISGFTGVDVTNATNFQLFADIKVGATSSNDFTISLVPGGVNIAPGLPEAFGTFSNVVDVTGLEADFTQNTDDATAFSNQNGVELLDFTVNSNGTQTISPNLVFTFNVNVTNILENWDLRVGGADIPGSENYVLNGPGTQLTISGFTGVDVTNATNFQLFADIQAGATTADDFIISLAPTGVTIAPGIAEAFGTFSNSIDIVTSQLSDITLENPTTQLIGYRTRQFPAVNNSDLTKSVRLATYQLRDGAGTDPDGQGTNMTSLILSITNSQYIRAISLFDDDSDLEIPGTEQTINGATVTTITFTPSAPVSAADDDVRNLMVRATFMDIVVDNDQIQLAITGATANASGSGFSPIGGWASTTTAAGDNLIDVVATKLVFNPALPTSVNVNTNFTIYVEALDGLNNLDTDQNDQFSLTEGGPGNLTSFGGTTLTPLLSGGKFQWTDLRLSQSGNYPMLASDDAYGDAMGGDATGNIIISSPACTITQPPDPVLCYGNAASAETLGNIVITETDPAGFSGAPGTYTFSLAVPSGFVFDQSITSGLALSGGDINSPSAYSYPSANVVQFSYNLTGTASNNNSITISGLKVQAPHPGTESPLGIGPLIIARSGGSATIAGVGPGTTLGTISANQVTQYPGLTFFVRELAGNPDVDSTSTSFNAGSAAVKLLTNPVSAQAQSVFAGSGVTTNPEYRFNPSSLSPGNYPITLTHTNNANGCQTFRIRSFEVKINGIIGLQNTYCSNEAPETGLSVNQTYINELMQYYQYPNDWVFDKFVYYNSSTFNWSNITTPDNTTFDPASNEYANTLAYFGGEIPIGFSVYNTNPLAFVPAGSNYVVTYQWVRVYTAPTVSFTIPKTAFCMGEASVDLKSIPQNSDDANVDYFRIDGAVDSRLTHVGTSPKIWKFTPGPTGGTEPVGSFNLSYSYLDPATGCRGTSPPTTITVNEVVPNISFPSNVCAGDPLTITNSTTLRTPATTIVNAGWDFGDQVVLPLGSYASSVPPGAAERTTGTYQNPSHLYQSNGTFQISALIETSDGCIYTTPSQPVNINALPVANFTWTNACLGTPTDFKATQNLSDAQIQSWNWDFSINDILTTGVDIGTNKNTTYDYPIIGKDTVRLVVITNTDCRDTVLKPVFIVPTYGKITDTTGYEQSFTSGANGWISGGIRPSWALGNTTAGTEPSDGPAWATTLTGPNNADERSWVMSGCFNFKYSVKPVISLDVWSDTPFGVDGAVLQYNDDGMVEDETSWKVLGDAISGINWYDGSGISNSPGNQSANDFGWTGSYPGWKPAIYKLDDGVKPASQTAADSIVVFRVAFAGGNRQQSGFAFDNVFIGERSRKVLLESFTNTAPSTDKIVATVAHNTKYDSAGKVSQGEIVKIQYHTPFPGNDLLNEENQQLNNARTAFYGITEAPTARLDGRYGVGGLINWFDTYNNDRVLTPSNIELDATTTKVGTDVKINITLTNTTSEALPLDGVHLFTVIVQTQIDRVGNEPLFGITPNNRFMYVAKQMLPSPAGIPLSGSLLGGTSYTGLPEITWSHPNGGDAIVVFVQRINSEDKNVYQAFILENPDQPDVVTGTEDLEYAKHINLYPNPANQELTIELPVAANKPVPVELHDAFGRVVYQSVFNVGERTKTVSTAAFADGIYLMQVAAPQGNNVVRKVMVKH